MIAAITASPNLNRKKGDAEQDLTPELDGLADILDVEESLLGIGFIGGIADMERMSLCCERSVIYREMSNSTDKFIGMIVGSLEMTNHHRTWDGNPRLVVENHDYGSQVREADKRIRGFGAPW
ncbi:hypothetical protein TNCV_3186761 [Trichonephila clavipes]|nr:hypothetical protein TNCV_3186761 [Trichonephila clavipes]